MTAYPHLFSPVAIGGRTLRNRIVHASMSTHYAQGGRITDRLIDYYANRARGGAAMLVSEPMAMLSWQQLPTRPAVLSGVNADALARWADAVNAHGSLMLGQVQDNGRGFRSGFRNPHAFGPSALPDDLSGTIPHALSLDQIARMIDEFAQSARALQQAGFAGVEISAGHGHLFHQFLARRSNIREDRYGGDLAGRSALLLELIQALRQSCGADFLIGVKLPGEDGMEDGIDLDEAARITALVHAGGGVDYLTYCWGAHGRTLYEHLPDLHGPRTPYVDRIAALGRHAPGVPLGALGLITDPNEGERIVRDGLADLVMLGRPLVTDPAWGLKAEAGREAQIRYCVGCNTCWHMINVGRGLHCDNNPRVGAADEADWQVQPAAERLRVAIVGAGVAGMEAAWVAAARGHEVTVFSASDEAGGKTRLHALLPGGENLSSVYDYQRLAAERAGAVFRWGTVAQPEDISALAPDRVILATGASPAFPAYLPEEYRDFFPDLRSVVAAFAERGGREPGTAVIHDADGTAFTYAAAELLLARFERVVLLTDRDRIAGEEAMVTRQGIQARFAAKGIQAICGVVPLASSRLEEGEVSYADVFTGAAGTLTDVALFTYATPRIPNVALEAPLRAAGIDVRLVGDAWAPRTVLAATSEGYRAAMEI
ncbi:FAD-dependent oxidoreductase [Sphingomonas sp. HITSZ_GF]|uniref:oxidoreductase n=1 Tax=Sphingomonas sp. HITSZ_GF TaxID=3037247 RepID=UPI00240D6972|nr:FAD-dependent oxidoreductase [Sphingomonas sp. HITSZ_GF]MDG2532146.1 FAD-dependent oxidoreductase [Sphingomonas sp. HITSZ_GF]